MKHTDAHKSAASLNRSAAYASIAMAIGLVGLKSWAAYTTGSSAMLGSLADSALDLASSIATLVGVWIAGQPADENHRFGHGKAEALSAMFQVVMIAISAILLALRSGQDLWHGTRTTAAGNGIWVSLIAIGSTLLLLAWQRHVIRSTASIAISTDHLHYKSDLILNLAVIFALLLDQYAGFTSADPLFGLAIALWLAWGAWRASNDAITQLMDHEWPEDKKARFLDVLSHHPELRGVHDMRTRTSGAHDFVQFHAWVDGDMSVTEAHRIMDEIEDRLLMEFPGVEILIHPDPVGHEDQPD